jgi:hypothetical protein
MSTALTTFVPILVGTNYQAWSAKMKAYLSSVNLWLIVSGTTVHPAQAGEPQANWDTANARAIGIISLMLVNHVLHKVNSLMTTAQPIAATQFSSTCVKLPRGLRVRLECLLVMAIIWRQRKMLPAELR